MSFVMFVNHYFEELQKKGNKPGHTNQSKCPTILTFPRVPDNVKRKYLLL